jgi:threonine synthase
MRGKRAVRVFMLSPHQRMTAFQAAQMFALPDDNIHNLAVKGVFDDCQDMVKAVNADAGFKARHRIGAVNSINWARVAAQVVYYFKAYFAVTRDDRERVSFAVPTGNFGNIYAGHVARRMGLPVDKLILATNENDVLDEFFRTGTYRVKRVVKPTTSPSMDISKASNFERYVFDLVNRDPARVRDLWRRLDAEGEFDLSRSPYWSAVAQSGFVSGKSSHRDRLETIRLVHHKYGAIIDPHTADGVKVALEHRNPLVPLVCLETAAPAKFAATIREALGREPERPAELRDLERRPQRFTLIEADAEAVKRYIGSHA